MVGITDIDQIPLIRVEDFLEHIIAAAFLVDGNGVVIYGNDPLARLAGITVQEIIGQSYTVLMSQFDMVSNGNASLMQDFAELLDQQDQILHLTIRTRQPVPCYRQLELFPIFTHSSDVFLGGIIYDIVPNQDGQAQQHNVLLAVTHELRSALVSIVGHITLLNSEDCLWEDKERQYVLRTINGQAQRLIWLLEDVRDAAKVEAKTLALDCNPSDLKDIILRAARGLPEQMSGNIGLLLDIPDGLPMPVVDSRHLGRAFQILFRSIFTLAVGQQVQVRVEQPDDLIQVSLIYQGNILATQFEEGKFSDLFQARSLVSSPLYDLELGFYVAQSIFRAHGGFVTVGHQSETEIVVRLTLPGNYPDNHRTTIPSHRASCGEITPPLFVTRPAKPNAKILLVEDDHQLCRFLKSQLSLNGYRVITTNEGRMALELAALEMPDLILLGLSLPDANGLDVCRSLREFTSTPIIIIASTSNEEDMIRSLNLGADDYLPEPLHPKALMARIQANLRRSYISDVYETTQGNPVFAIGDLEINFAQRQVSRQGKLVALTPVEHKLMYYLVANAGRILTHEQLISKVWGPMFRQETQYLWVNISRLRGKIEDDPHNPKYILTERGVGYYMPCPSDFDIGRM